MTPVPSYTNSVSCTAVICLFLADVIFGFCLLISSLRRSVVQNGLCKSVFVSKFTNCSVGCNVWFGYESFLIRWFGLERSKMVCLTRNLVQN